MGTKTRNLGNLQFEKVSVPPFPGATKTVCILGSFLTAQAREFSRPPLPITRTLSREGSFVSCGACSVIESNIIGGVSPQMCFGLILSLFH